jgi:hypothetical protein
MITMKLTSRTLIGAGALLSAAMMLAQPPGPPPGGFRGGRGPGGPEFGGPGGGRGFGPGGRQPTVANAPYSAMETTVSTQTLANGNQITRNESTQVYRDSQGRVRTETTMTPRPGSAANAQARTMVTIFDPVEGSVSRIDSERMVVEKSMLPTGNPGRRGPPQDGNGRPRPENRNGGAAAPGVLKEELGTRVIASLTATGKRTTTTIAANAVGNTQPIQSVHEIWMSSDLQVPVMMTSSDPRSGTRVTQLTNVTRNEPDPALFQAPAGYTVKTHSGPRGGGPR